MFLRSSEFAKGMALGTSILIVFDAECQQEREHSLVYLCVHSSSLKILIGQILKELKLFTESKPNDTRKPKNPTRSRPGS